MSDTLLSTSSSHRLPVSAGCVCVVLMVLGTSMGSAQDEYVSDLIAVLQMAIRDTSVMSSTQTPLLSRPEWHSMITNLPGDWGLAATRTASVQALPALAGIGMLTGVMIATDRATYRTSREFIEGRPAARSLCDAMEHVGDGRFHLGIAAVFGIVGLATDDSRALRTASQTVEALLATGVVVQVLKRITGRESPAVATTDGGTWRFFPNQREYHKHQTRYYAFPSGHIATTMSTVTVIAENYPGTDWIKPIGYTLVGLVGVSLVDVRFHWYSDLPLGIAIGYTFGKIVAHRDDPEGAAEKAKQLSKFSIVPSVGLDGAGIRLALSF